MTGLIDHTVDKVGERIALEAAKIRAEFAAGLAETVNSLRVTGTRAKSLVPNGVNHSGAGRLIGWTIRESSGTNPATVTVYGGRDPGADPIIGTALLAAGATANHAWGIPGVSFGDGCYVAVSGAVVGSLLFGAVD